MGFSDRIKAKGLRPQVSLPSGAIPGCVGIFPTTKPPSQSTWGHGNVTSRPFHGPNPKGIRGISAGSCPETLFLFSSFLEDVACKYLEEEEDSAPFGVFFTFSLATKTCDSGAHLEERAWLLHRLLGTRGDGHTARGRGTRTGCEQRGEGEIHYLIPLQQGGETTLGDGQEEEEEGDSRPKLV